VSERPPEDYREDPDTQLMMAFAAGDDGAFEKIIDRFQRQVYGVVRRYLGKSSSAEDCAQEVFLRLFKMRRSYKPKARLGTLVYRIASNLCMNFARDEARRKMLALDASYGADEEPLAAAVADPGAVAPDMALESRERAVIVRRALNCIPDRQRMAIILHRFEGLSYAEIADALETNIDAVKSLLSRARASLAEELEGDIQAGNL